MSDAAARPDGSASAAGHVYSAFTILGDLPGDDDGNEMAVLQTWETPVIQFHVRPRTTRHLQGMYETTDGRMFVSPSTSSLRSLVLPVL